MGNALVAQSGGPTTAINASLVGVVKGAVASGKFDKVLGGLHGIVGVMDEKIVELSTDEAELSLIYRTPSSYLGSCRYKMPLVGEDDALYDRVLEVLTKWDVSAFFYIGGNDSMDTIAKLATYGKQVGSDIRFIGVPKTIDNDLVCTDHAPGYGSAAKYIATSMLDIAHDTAVYEAPCVTIVEIMGRDAGWLTASAALARNKYNPTPQLIYLPEVAFSRTRFIQDVKDCLSKTNNVVVAVSEGIRDDKGLYLSAKMKAEDKFGHMQLSGVGKYLENLVKDELSIKCRSVELSILQRCAAHIASKTDLDEAVELGKEAANLAAQGLTGVMPILKRGSNDPYTVILQHVDISTIANQESKVPREWINELGNDVTDKMIEYIKPLVQGEVVIGYSEGLPVYGDISHLTKKEEG